MGKKKIEIDVGFDFTTDSPRYWENFWENRNGLGAGSSDPDMCSKTLQKYHQLLWSKELPNGEMMELSIGSGPNYLRWGGFRFGSDSIIVSFRYERYRYMIDKIKNSMPRYESFVEDYIRRSYTIGGMMIFPKRSGGINQSKGCNPYIKDRWDLTLECIRRYYNNQSSPLSATIEEDASFFRLFVDFKGYVDYFYLQDCVSSDYKSVIFWIGNGDFGGNPLPQTVDEYLHWIDCELRFVEQRNARIRYACGG